MYFRNIFVTYLKFFTLCFLNQKVFRIFYLKGIREAKQPVNIVYS